MVCVPFQLLPNYENYFDFLMGINFEFYFNFLSIFLQTENSISVANFLNLYLAEIVFILLSL